jgi:hypothetical protein
MLDRLGSHLSRSAIAVNCASVSGVTLRLSCALRPVRCQRCGGLITAGARLAVAGGWLGPSLAHSGWVWRAPVVALVAGLAVINATGVYAQLVAAHVGERGAAQSALEIQAAGIEVRIEKQAHIVATSPRTIDRTPPVENS